MGISKESEQKIIDILKQEIPNLYAVYIFGSQIDGSANSSSDIDIAFLNDSKIDNLKRWEVANKIAQELLIDVDLVDLKETNTVFKFQIVSTAKRVYGKGFKVDNFEMLAYSFYLRFQEDRKGIIENIIKTKTVLGDS